MKFLLTSGGIYNKSIHNTLVDMLGKPIANSNALCIPTAMYGHPWVGPGVKAWQFISGNSEDSMDDLAWKSVGVLELTALTLIDEDRWVPLVRETDVLLVAGATPSTCATGCNNPGWQTSCRRCTQSMWD